LTPAVACPAFCWPVSSSAPIRSPPVPSAPSRPPMTNRRITLTAAWASQLAWLSSRWVLSGVASPTCSAMVQPLLAQIGHAGPDVLARLDPRLDPHEAAPDAADQLTGPAGLYHEASSRLWFCSRHTDRTTRRLRPCPPNPYKITSTGARSAAAHSTKCDCPTRLPCYHRSSSERSRSSNTSAPERPEHMTQGLAGRRGGSLSG
jgi:hypothetical protein